MAGGPGVPTAVVSAAHIQTSPQAKVLLHMSGQMTVNQARSAVRTGRGAGPVAPGRGPRPTSDLLPQMLRRTDGTLKSMKSVRRQAGTV